MDPIKTGKLIRALRMDLGLTQQQLAVRLHVGDKAVSKWERGAGCPDLSLLPALAEVLGVGLENLLAGELDANESTGGNMKRTKFYVCPDCGNIVTASAEAALSCCGRPLIALEPQKADLPHCLTIEPVENELFITSTHPMEKEHYIAFTALLRGDSLLLRRLYPEWDMQVRIPAAHGRLLWYCTRHGLFCQNI
ncbi:MAG: helix-turn-helix domain-containing protein [Oscillospiraceae bacterium]|nr:helix-turn-helix domain-containing protein [Oscillospiraceae bacterium]